MKIVGEIEVEGEYRAPKRCVMAISGALFDLGYSRMVMLGYAIIGGSE
jgi:hypothetical protein